MCLSGENGVRLNSTICQIENTLLFKKEKNHLPAIFRAISMYINIIEKCVRNDNISKYNMEIRIEHYIHYTYI